MLHIVVAVIYNKNNQILIAQRAQGKHQAGKWEFPGGKVEQSESAQQALTRELDEELGIQITSAKALLQIRHHYKKLSVFLDVYTVRDWQGEAYGKEGQGVRWIDQEAMQNYSFPAANKAILQTLKNIDLNLPSDSALEEMIFYTKK